MISYSRLLEYNYKFGDSFYLVDLERFGNNYDNMLKAFRYYYQNTHIAYSFKTNYLPKICGTVKSKGGYAEIVSGMELELARKIGFTEENIYYNGPCKKKMDIEKLLLLGGHVNLDGMYEIETVESVANNNPDKILRVGIRCLGNIGQENPSRFGFDIENGDFEEAIYKLSKIKNVRVEGLHLHLPFRNIESFVDRMKCVEKILDVFEKYGTSLQYFSLGGGYMGEIPERMKATFSFNPPQYEDYASVVAGGFNKLSSDYECIGGAKLIIEPGSALVSDAVKYVTKVINIKRSGDRVYATVEGSTFNINPQVKGMARPFNVYYDDASDEMTEYDNVYLAGYTCIESDYLATGYTGRISVGDYIVFDNIGSYSLTMKPSFINYDSAYIDIESGEELARRQKFDDVFSRFSID